MRCDFLESQRFCVQSISVTKYIMPFRIEGTDPATAFTLFHISN
jgi:hypothetical protein